jgi:carbamoyltransferase
VSASNSNILGLSAYYHDAAACLVQDGIIVAAVQEERWSRKKHDSRFPARSVEYCLTAGGITVEDIDLVVFYDKPFTKFDRLLETYLDVAPAGLRSFLSAMPVWIREKFWLKETIQHETGYTGKILFPEHHESHAASAFFPSPFEEAAFLTIDGVGEWATTTYGAGRGNRLTFMGELHFPHSLGLLYSAFTYFCGFKVNSGEYKLMGLAPYGTPRYLDTILEKLIDLRDDGSFRLNMGYFTYCRGLTMTGRRFSRLFGGGPRQPETPITQREMDIAASIQAVTEMAVMNIANYVHARTGMKRLVLAGGVALNCVANGKLQRNGPFDELWIQPAAGDAGGALGGALFGWYQYLGHERLPVKGMDQQFGSYLGPEFDDDTIRAFLDDAGLPYERLGADRAHRVAALIAADRIVGWFQGRMEFGPRALGARSILGDARNPETQARMNLKIKYRESFRPFAPSVLAECSRQYFQLAVPSPYMLLVAKTVPEIRMAGWDRDEGLFGIEKLKVVRSDIPAVTHVDQSARVQTVHRETNPDYHELLTAFREQTGCGVIVNTSFNVRGEPIVCTPQDAYTCFMRTEMDALVMGDFLLQKAQQPEWRETKNWRETFEPD